MSLVNQERTLSYLRLPRITRRRRVRPLLAWLGRLARWGLLVAVLAGGAAWCLGSPVFALKGLSVESGERVQARWVEERLAVFDHHNLLRLDLVEIRARLLGHEWIRSVELKKRLPDHLWVRVVEHRPLAMLRRDEAFYYLDADGGIITRAEQEAGWLIVEAAGAAVTAADPAREERRAASSRRRALELAALLEREPPAGGPGRLIAISILGEEDYRLEFERLPYVLLVTPESARTRMTLFGRLRDQLALEVEGWGAFEAVDLRFAGRIILRPTAAADAAGRTSEG